MEQQLIRVHSYESTGTFDGPGLRYVVFLQGCPFRCLYCANPDTIEAIGQSKLTSPDYIVEQAESLKPFFGKRGGVTFSGGEPTVQAKALLKETDLVLLDVKEIRSAQHEHITGRPNTQTLATAAWLEENERPFWLRYVLVPGLSDAEEDLRALGEHFKNYKMIERVELLPYHRLGVHKYESLGWDYQLKDTKENTAEQLKHAEDVLREYFPQLVVN